jgi:hypothetical protein
MDHKELQYLLRRGPGHYFPVACGYNPTANAPFLATVVGASK